MRTTRGDLALWQAVLALVGVVLGGAIAGGVTLRQLRLITDREHEARQAERELARQDARRVFQRNTILAIQDAVADLLRMVVYLHDEAVNAEEKTGHWPAPRRFDELPASLMSISPASRACALGSSMKNFVDS